jgi:hypothetical protein
VVDKYYDKNFKFMLILLLLVIAFGTANRVIYKIQLYSRPPLLVAWSSACAVCVCVRAEANHDCDLGARRRARR